MTDTHLAAIFALAPRPGKLTNPNQAISHWLATCRQELQNCTTSKPVKPQDYRRAHKLSCHCRDCSQLSLFLADPKQRVLRLPLNTERRRHMHGIIDSDGCDLTHVTERRGRPFTLVCTKTVASYERALEIYKRDTNNLARIRDLEQRIF